MSVRVQLQSFTKEALDRLRLKTWKHFVETLRSIHTDSTPDHFLLTTYIELCHGKAQLPKPRSSLSEGLFRVVKRKILRIWENWRKERQAQGEGSIVKPTSDSGENGTDTMPIEQVKEDLEAFGLNIEKFHKEVATILGIPKLPSERLLNWITQLWEPEWAGQEVTAADISEQEEVFTVEGGQITIRCYWEREQDRQPAYLRLAWDADLASEKNLWIRFVNPETQTIRFNLCLRTIYLGEETFTSDELGFDPYCEPWAISVGLEEFE